MSKMKMYADMDEEQIRDEVMYCIDYCSVRDAIRLIEKYNVDVNKPDSNSCCFLSVAVRSNLIELVTYLLKKGAKPDVKDGTGLTALEWAKTRPEIGQLFQELLKKMDSKEPILSDEQLLSRYKMLQEEQIKLGKEIEKRRLKIPKINQSLFGEKSSSDRDTVIYSENGHTNRF